MKNRKVLAIVTGVLLAPLAACGAAGDKGPSGACAGKESIKVGALFALTGPAAELGQLSLDGVKMAVQDINAGKSPVFGTAEPGINGKCVELVTGDNKNDPTEAAAQARRLVQQEGVEVLIGPSESPAVGPTLSITAQANVPQGIGSVTPVDYSKSPQVFRDQVWAGQLGPAFIRYMEKRGWSTAAVMATDDAFGQGMVEAVKGAAKGTTVKITDVQTASTGTVDVTPQMQHLKASKADVVLMFNIGADAVAALQAKEQVGWDVPALGTVALIFPDVVKAIGLKNLDDVFVTLKVRGLSRPEGNAAPMRQQATAFIDRYKRFIDQDPIDVYIDQAAIFYDELWMFKTAADAENSTDASKITPWLEKNGFSGVTADYTFSSETHDGVPDDDLVFVRASTLKDGTLEIAPGS